MFSGFAVHSILLMVRKESWLKMKWVYFAIYTPGVIFTLREFTGSLYAVDFIRIGYGISEVPDVGGIWFWIFLLHQTGCELLGLYLLFVWGRRSPVKRENKQATIMIFTTSVSLVLAFTSDILLPAMNIFVVPSLSPLFILIWGYGIWYSISRYKFMSLNLAFTSDEFASRIQDLFFVLDLDWNIIKINNRVVDLLGFDERDILKSSFHNILKNKETISSEFQSIAENNESRFETEFNTKNDVPIPVKIHGSILRDKFGDPIGMVIIAIDLREKIKLERETRERVLSEEKYRIIVENIKESYYELDKFGNYTFVNQSMCKIFGRTMDELIGLNYRDYMPEDSARFVFTVFNRVFTMAVKAELVEIPIYQKDGGLRFIEVSIDLRTDSNGNGVGFRGMVRDTTERKKAVMSMLESEKKYRHLIENAHEIIYKTDWRGNFIFSNLAFQIKLEYTNEEVCHLHYLALIPPENRESEFAFYSKHLKNKIDESYRELPVLTKSGKILWIEQSVKSIKDEAGRIAEFDCIVHDITGRKAAEDALRESEERYRLVMENINDAVFICKLDGHLKYMSPSMVRMTGYSADEMLNAHYLHYIHPDYRELSLDLYNKQVQENIEVTEHEYLFIAKGGGIIWVGQTVRMVKNNKGEIEFFGVIRDISERKAAEEALRKSEERYQQLMENVTDCVFICKLDGHFKYFNPAVTRLFGIPQNELVGAHFLSIVHPEYRQRQLKFYQNQVRENIETTYYEFPILMKNDEIKWVGQTVRMIRNYEGDVEFYGITRDITDLKNAEDARRDLEKAKTRFFSNISHEIRTPLTLMLGPIESVLQGDYNGEVDNEFFETLHRNTLRLLALVNNLLDFSKIEAGKMIMKVLEGDIVAFARSYITSMESVGKTRKIEMRFNSYADSIMLYFDPERLDKVLMNLLSNAFKFTGTGGVIAITVSEDDDHCRIVVADTGEGIPEKSLSAIFERFNQADTASARKNQGTGIGLALAKELVEMHGGTITAESRYISDYPDNHGSIFTITLPKGRTFFENSTNVEIAENTGLDAFVKDYRAIGIREIAELKNDDTASAGCENMENVPTPGIEKSILVVDDNADMRNFLRILLQKRYRVILAENGEEGIRCARKHRPNLIVTDVMMPVMNGFEMTAIIKKDEVLKTTPVIMLTADTELNNKVAGLEFGADDYLHKPFNSLELMTRISSLLNNYEYQQIISRRNRDIESELDVARMLHKRLLPVSMPEVPGYHEYVVYNPMDKVGGDFYNVERREDFIDIFIADVSGHGLSSAFLATVTKIALENITARTTPDKVLHLLNNVIHRHTVRCNFVTAFYAIIDINTGAMSYSSAGHTPPFLYRKKNDEFIELMAKGTPLGWFQNIRIEEKIINLESGDRIVFYTDGITECSNPANDLFDEIGLQNAIREHAGRTAEEFSCELMKELEAYHGQNTFDDDITMLVLDVV